MLKTLSDKRAIMRGLVFSFAITIFPFPFLYHGDWLYAIVLLLVQFWAFNFHEVTLKLRQTGRWVLVYFIVADVLGVIGYLLKELLPAKEEPTISVSLFFTLVVLMVFRQRNYRSDFFESGDKELQ